MINIYLGNTLAACSAKILESIKKRKEKGNHVLIVPDRFTLSTELKVLEEVGSTMNVEVMTFARLAMRVLDKRAKKCLSPEGAVMLLAKSLDKCRDRLLCYSKICGSVSFASEMYASISAVRNSGITVEQLQKAAEKLKGYIKDKTQDIVTIYSNYIAELQDNYIDSTTRLEALRDTIKDSEYIAGTDFYITDFYAFTGIQYDIIRLLMQNAAALNIAAIADIGGDNRRIYPQSVRNRLIAVANECEVEVNTIDSFEKLTLPKEIIQNNIFGYGSYKYQGLDYVSLYKAMSIEDELIYICHRISEAVRNEGKRYKDIAIVCGDIVSYTPVIQKVFDRFSIPYFMDTKSLLSNEPLIKALLLYLRVNLNNYSRTTIIEYAKNYFSNIGARVYEFENYCIKYSIDYTRFLSEFKIGKDEEYISAEGVRAELISQLTPLPQKAKISEYIDLLYDLIKINGYDGRLAAFAERQKKYDINAAAATAQVPLRLKELLGELNELAGADECSLQQFYDLVKSGFDSAKIAIIPQSADCIYIGEAEDSRYENKEILFVAGAADGYIPFDSKDSGILSEKEYVAWQAADIVVQPTAREKSLHSRFYTEQLLLIPSQKLYVGYSVFDVRGKKQSPSVVVEQLASLFDTPVQDVSRLDEHCVFTVKNAYKTVLDGIRNRRRGLNDINKIARIDTIYYSLPEQQREAIDNIVISKYDEIRSGLGLFFTSKHTSISQLECYFGCPYKHFIRYGLFAKERESGEVEARETGTVIHDTLEMYFRESKDFNISDKEIVERANAIIDNIYKNPRFESMLLSENAVQLERLRREALQIVLDLTHLMQQSDFVPTEFEVQFGGKDSEKNYDGIKLLDGQIELVGKIDRIDTLGDYVAVIDYKTGNVDADLKYVYYGKKIQLYVYLGALRQAGKIPCAAFYLSLKANYRKEDKAFGRYCYQGQLINDSTIIESFDTEISDRGISPIIPVKTDKNGYKSSKNLLSSTDMDNIINYVIKVSDNAASEILEGNILPNPAKDECNYCLSKDFCGYDKDNQRAIDSVELSYFEVNDEL